MSVPPNVFIFYNGLVETQHGIITEKLLYDGQLNGQVGRKDLITNICCIFCSTLDLIVLHVCTVTRNAFIAGNLDEVSEIHQMASHRKVYLLKSGCY